MPRIPDHDYSVSQLEEKKLYAVTYRYQVNGIWYADTWNISECKNLGEALERVDKFCDGNLNARHFDAYEITNINIIR